MINGHPIQKQKKNHHFIELVMITKKKRKSYQKLGLARPLAALWSPSLVSHDGALSVSLFDRCRPHFLVLVIGHFLSLLLESPRSRGYCVFFKNFFTTCYQPLQSLTSDCRMSHQNVKVIMFFFLPLIVNLLKIILLGQIDLEKGHKIRTGKLFLTLMKQ